MGFSIPTAPYAAEGRARFTGSMAYSINVGVPAIMGAFGLQFPSDAKKCTISISNQNASYPNVAHGATITGVDVAIYKSDGTFRSKRTGSSLVSWLGQTIPAAGVPWTSPEFDAVTLGALGTDNQLVVIYQLPAAEVLTQLTVKHGRYVLGSNDVNSPPAEGSFADNPNAHMTIRGYCSTRRPRILCGADSLTQGYDLTSTLFRADGAFVKIGRVNDWAVDTIGLAGMSLLDWNANGNTTVNTGALITGSVCVSDMSINDLDDGGLTLAGFQARVATKVANWKALGAFKIIWCTLSPSTAMVAFDALRVSINSWLTGGGISGIDTVCDVDLVVKDPAVPSQLLAAYNAGDGNHWNTAGHAAVATALATSINVVI